MINLKIIAKKEGVYNYEAFINQSIESDYITGIFLEITVTKDKEVLIFSPVDSNYTSIGSIQNNTLGTIKQQSTVLLDGLLQTLDNYKKKIFLQLLPFDSIVITDKNFEQIAQYYEGFVNIVLKIIAKYPNLDISICSTNHSVLYHLLNKKTKYKIGMIFAPENLNYMDVDYYVFDGTNINTVLINELFNQNKDVMIRLGEHTDISDVYNHIEKSNDPEKLEQMIQIIDSKPSITHDYIVKNNMNK